MERLKVKNNSYQSIMEIFPSLLVFLVSLFSFLILMSFFGFKCISFRSKSEKNLPPSPPKLPIIGNFHQLGTSPHRSLQALSKKYGQLMLIRLGSVPVLIASSAEAAREILKTHDAIFSNRPSLTVPNLLYHGSTDIAFARYGEHWRQLKSIVVLQLLSNTRVKSFQKVREEEMRKTICMIEERCGSVIDLSASFVSLTNNIICKLALGRTYHEVNFTDLLTNLSRILGAFSVGDYIPWLSWMDSLSGLKGRVKLFGKQLDDFLQSVIDEHQNKKIGENDQSDQGQDLVDILLDVQRDNTIGFTLHTQSLKSVIANIFTAGTDTVFSTIDWTICELVKHPRVMKKLQQEVTEIAQGRSMIIEEDLEKMGYLKAVIKESLRLHSPTPLNIPRESTQEVKLMGYDIPKGTQVIINSFAIGRDPLLWEEPEEFRPERFLNNSIDYKGNHYEWLPFGGGRRKCPGIQFSVVLIELALANVVYKFNLALPDGVKEKDMDMSEGTGISIHRKASLLVTPSPRF